MTSKFLDLGDPVNRVNELFASILNVLLKVKIWDKRDNYMDTQKELCKARKKEWQERRDHF